MNSLFPRLAISCSILSLSATVFAQDKVYELDSVDVVSTATRTAQPIKGVSATVQVIDQKSIVQSGAQSLKDIFDNTPGLVLQYGTFPSASSASKSSVSLRGMGATGSLWLMDGRRLAGEVKNPYDMDRIPASSIERIEIVKGPMSALYGADAVGGVINIITKRPKSGKAQGTVSLTYGSNSDGEGANTNVSASLRGGNQKVRYSINASQQKNDPYTELEKTQTRLGANPTPPPLANVKSSYDVPVTYREASEVSTLTGRVEWDASNKTTLGLEATWFEEERTGVYRGTFHPTGFSPQPNKTVPAFDVPVRSKDDNQRTDVAMDIKHQATDNLDLKARVYQSKYKKRNNTTMTEYADFAYSSEEASAASGMDGNVDITAVETSATWYSPNDKHIVTGGVEVRDENREATVFTQSGDLSERGVSSKAAFIQDEWQATDSTKVTLGGRYDEYTQDAYTDALGNQHATSKDSKTTFRVGVNKALTKQVNVRANVAQGYRVPDLRELYIQKQTPAGVQLGAYTIDPTRNKTAYDLKPEAVTAFEVGVNGKAGKLNYDVAAFYNDIEDRIEQVQVGAGTQAYYTFQNVSEATTKGVEMRADYAVNDKVKVKTAWSELATENKETGRDLELTPERVVMAGVDWQTNPRLQLGANVTHTGKQSYTEDNSVQTADGFNTVNLNANYALDSQKKWKVLAGVRNATDETVDKRLGSSVGRFMHVGLRGEF